MSLMVKANNIQDIWLIEENAIIFRNFIVFSPPSAPIYADRIEERIIIWIIKEEVVKYEINIIGANFWIVIKMIVWSQDIPSITCGNQKWKGAAPNLRSSAIRIVMEVKFDICIIRHLERIIKVDASAWIRKYFRAASAE